MEAVVALLVVPAEKVKAAPLGAAAVEEAELPALNWKAPVGLLLVPKAAFIPPGPSSSTSTSIIQHHENS